MMTYHAMERLKTQRIFFGKRSLPWKTDNQLLITAVILTTRPEEPLMVLYRTAVFKGNQYTRRAFCSERVPQSLQPYQNVRLAKETRSGPFFSENTSHFISQRAGRFAHEHLLRLLCNYCGMNFVFVLLY